MRFQLLALVVLLASVSEQTEMEETSSDLIENGITILVQDIEAYKQSYTKFNQLIEARNKGMTLRLIEICSMNIHQQYHEHLSENIFMLIDLPKKTKSTLHCNTTSNTLMKYLTYSSNIFIAINNVTSPIVGPLEPISLYNFRKSSISHVTGDVAAYPSTNFLYSGDKYNINGAFCLLGCLNRQSTRGLIGAMENRYTGARIIISGSLEFFSDESFHKSDGANERLSSELIKWFFKEKGLLRIAQVTYRNLASTLDATTIIADHGSVLVTGDFEYRIVVEIYQDNRWGPHVMEEGIELKLVDRFGNAPVTKTMQSYHNGTYTAELLVTDLGEISSLMIEFDIRGFNYVSSKSHLIVLPTAFKMGIMISFHFMTIMLVIWLFVISCDSLYWRMRRQRALSERYFLLINYSQPGGPQNSGFLEANKVHYATQYGSVGQE